MARVDMIALQTFLNGGNLINEGETFSANEGMVSVYTSGNMAKRADEQGTVEPAVVNPEEVPTVENMTATQLKQAAKTRGIAGASTMSKQELIDVLKGSI